MSEDAKKTGPSPFVIDARDVASFLVDLPRGATRGMKRAQEGFDLVLLEIFANQPKLGETIGILSRDVEELRLLTARLELIAKHLPNLRKLLELMVETELVLDNRRQQLVRTIAKTVDNAAYLNKSDSISARYEETRNYRSAPAKKGVKTRQRRAALAAQRKAEALAKAEKEGGG